MKLLDGSNPEPVMVRVTAPEADEGEIEEMVGALAAVLPVMVIGKLGAEADWPSALEMVT